MHVILLANRRNGISRHAMLQEGETEAYDIFLLPPGEDIQECQSWLRMRNKEGRYNLMFAEWFVRLLTLQFHSCRPCFLLKQTNTLEPPWCLEYAIIRLPVLHHLLWNNTNRFERAATRGFHCLQTCFVLL